MANAPKCPRRASLLFLSFLFRGIQNSADCLNRHRMRGYKHAPSGFGTKAAAHEGRHRRIWRGPRHRAAAPRKTPKGKRPGRGPSLGIMSNCHIGHNAYKRNIDWLASILDPSALTPIADVLVLTSPCTCLPSTERSCLPRLATASASQGHSHSPHILADNWAHLLQQCRAAPCVYA